MTIKRIICGNVNCFLVQDGDDAILVDTGTVKYRAKVDDECQKVHLSLIVLTHGHSRHIQNAQYLAKKYHVPIAIHKLDYPLTKDNFFEPLYAHTWFGNILLWLEKRYIRKEKAESFLCSVFLKEGMVLNEYGVDATVIRLTGHTKGSIGLKIGTKDFIVGDALMHIGKPSMAKFYGNYEKAKQSVQIISQSGDRMIHFGHGKSMQNRYWNR